MAEWLGDTPIFQSTMTERERREFALFKTKVKATSNEEDTMATKKNTAQTTINESKEDTTMNETTELPKTLKEFQMNFKGIPMGVRKNGNAYYNRAADIERHKAIRNDAKLSRIKGIEVGSCIPGETTDNFTDDPAEVVLLGKAAKKFGWGNEFCTVAKALKYHGTPNPDYEGHGWLVQYKPYVYKTGERAGQTKEPTITVVYPKEAFIWLTESGEPEFDTEKKALADARKAQREAREAAKALKEANAAAGIKPTRRRRTSKKSNEPAKKQVITEAPVPAAAPAKLIHIKLANGVEFDARDAKEAAELKALFA